MHCGGLANAAEEIHKVLWWARIGSDLLFIYVVVLLGQDFYRAIIYLFFEYHRASDAPGSVL